MDKLLGYYERELAFLQDGARAFAEKYPRVASGLMLSEQGSEDPHVNRLIQSVALLTARVNMRLGDDHGGFAANLVDGLWPQFFQPIPSSTVARFKRVPAGGTRPPGWFSAMSRGVKIPFQPLHAPRYDDPDVTAVSFEDVVQVPMASGHLWSGAALSLTFGDEVQGRVRLYIDGDASHASVVRDALAFDVADVAVPGPKGTWSGGGRLSPVEVSDMANVLEHAGHDQPAFMLIREFFACPEKFAFFDIELPAGAAVRHVKLLLAAKPGGCPRYPALGRLGARQLVTRAAPMVNRFDSTISFGANGGHRSAYLVKPTDGGQVLAIRSVALAAPVGGRDATLPHYFSTVFEHRSAAPASWVVHAGAAVPGERRSDGALSLMLIAEPGAQAFDESLAVTVSQCNGDLASHLARGTVFTAAGDRGEVYAAGELVTVPSPCLPSAEMDDAPWRVLSHFRLGHMSLLGPDASELRQFLTLHAPARSALRHAIGGIRTASRRATVHWLPGVVPPTLVRGTEITLGIDESAFVGQALSAWIFVLERFFAGYAHINSFTQLVLRAAESGKELHRCPPRSGNGPLV